jgi:FtsP/CotA-like multicopper oxidase with cupredoxin domain
MVINRGFFKSSTLSVASLMISSVLFGIIQQGFISAYGQTPLMFPLHAATATPQSYEQHVIQYDIDKNCALDQHTPTDFKTYLTHFACGHVTVLKNGTTVRHFTLIADDYHGVGAPIKISLNKTDPVIFHAWMFNGSIPGPTMRMTQGDHVQITVYNSKDSSFIHSFHMHSIHTGLNDGVMGQGGMIFPGQSFTYDFIANPTGVYPYHCHMAPVQEHVSRGLYGMIIIDPPTPRPRAVEMVMMLGSYSFSYQGLNGSGHLQQTLPATMQQIRNNLSDVEEASDENNGPDNQFYFVNQMPFGYMGKNMIHLQTNTPYRIYLANMVEFDNVNSFHMHGNMFYYIPSGTEWSSKVYTDIVTLGQGDRGILEFKYPLPGEFMFHAHINHFTDLGWVGFFNVTKS